MGQFQLGESRTLLHLSYATRAVEAAQVDCREGRVEEKEPQCDWKECYESDMVMKEEEKKSSIVVGATTLIQGRASSQGRRTWN